MIKNYNQLFKDRFDVSQKIDDTFVNIANTIGMKDAINYLISMGATKIDIEDFIIMYKISEFTKSKYNDEEKRKIIESLSNIKDYVISSKVEYNQLFKLNEAVINTTQGEIHAIEFSSFAPLSKEKMPYIDTDYRHGKCYTMAYHTCLNLGIPNDVVTGYVYGYTDKSEYLHSWIETKINGEYYVIDGTLNALINKEGYYLIKHAIPINRISNKIVFDDIDKYLEKIGSNIPIEVYFVFRDEIIGDLEKNKELFEGKIK